MADVVVYVDFDQGTDGVGSSGDPYNNLASAVAHFTTKDLTTSGNDEGEALTYTIKLRNSSGGTEVVTAEANFSAYTTDATYFITIEADTGYEPTGSGPAIKIDTTSNIAILYPSNHTVIDGVWFRAAYAFSDAICIDNTEGYCTVRNAIVEGDFATSGFGIGIEDASGNNETSYYENVLFLNGSYGLHLAGRRAEPILRSCTFAENDLAITANGGTAIGPGSTISGSLFYGSVTGDIGGDADGYFVGGSYNATTEASAPLTDPTNWVTSVSTTDGVDVEEPSTGDYRAAASGVLDDGDQSGDAPATDMFGTSRPQGTFDDIGYYEIVAASSEDTLLADDVESASEVSSPSVGQEHALLADDVESASEVSSPSVGQEHALLADDVESASEVSSPAVAQEHALLADDVQSTSEVSAPAIGQEQTLLADDVQSTSEISTPALGDDGYIYIVLVDPITTEGSLLEGYTGDVPVTGDRLIAERVTSPDSIAVTLNADGTFELANTPSSPQTISRYVIQADGTVGAEADYTIDAGALAVSIESATEISAPAIGQEHALSADDAESASTVSAPALGSDSNHSLLADDVESAAEVSSAALGQEHALSADDAESASTVSAPALGSDTSHSLLADDVESSAEVSSAALGQEHALSADDAESASTVSAPALASAAYNLVADDVESAAEVSSAALGQFHALLANDAESAIELSGPLLGQLHALSADDAESASAVSVPALIEGIIANTIFAVPVDHVDIRDDSQVVQISGKRPGSA